MRPYVVSLAMRAGVDIELRKQFMACARAEPRPDLRAVHVANARRMNCCAVWYLKTARREWQYMEHDIEGLRADLERAVRELMRERA